VDKKNTTIGILFVIAALGCYLIGARFGTKQVPPAQVQQAVAQQEAAAPAAPALGSPLSQAAFAAAAAERKGATITTLENGFVKVEFTNLGGAVRDVALKKYPAVLHEPELYVINQPHADPLLAFVALPGLDKATEFQLVSQTPMEVVYRTVFDGRLEVTKRFVLSPDQVGATDPYQLRSEISFRNVSTQAVAAFRVSLAVGTAAPTTLVDRGDKLATGFSNGKDQTFYVRAKLEQSGGLFGLGAHDALPSIVSPGPIAWSVVKNQFFSTILTPDQPAADLVTRRVKLFEGLSDTTLNAYGVASDADFDLPALAPNGTATLGMNLYAGPNEYHRLSNSDVFKADQDRVMQFGTYSRFFSAILLTLMTWVHTYVPNWGVSIILTTLMLRTALMLFTIPAARSARRMQKIAPDMKLIKEKFKDNPQKQQQATMELFKKHKVNPLGGCIPMLLTMPFWLGFFAMLRSAAELRFAPFLWASDLSVPDTVWTFGHGALPLIGTFNLNILPLLLCAVTFMQMRLTPQPTVDNSQAQMMKFTPLFMMLVCYSYSCALALYSTTNGLFMIGQQMLVNRMKDDGDPTHGEGAVEKTGGKTVKNVTPKKK
jgi:YidC/Oxa1 family membrane protein insertase